MSDTSNELVFYHTPGTCSCVAFSALEEVELSFEDRPVDIFKGAQFKPGYRAINPKSKVPALLVGSRLLTETPAIILWLTQTAAGEMLLPGADPLSRAQAFADLVWCSNTLHPLARTIRMPQRVTSGEAEPVREIAGAAMLPILESLDARVVGQPWWFGDRWSVVDVYVAWILDMCEGGGMNLSHLSELQAHRLRMRARPSFQRVLARETRALETAGIELPGGGRL